MQDKKDESVCTCKACSKPVQTIGEVLRELFSRQTAADIKDDLWKMFIAAIGSTEMNGETERCDIALLFRELTGLIDSLEVINLKQTA